MPLTITSAVTPVGPPILDDPATIEGMARAQGSAIPRGSTVVGITMPIIRSDQTGLQYHTRNNGTEFRFNTGTLRLTLRQEVHLSRALNPCAQTIWLQHEQKHVRDNEQLMGRMDQELRADQEFADMLVTPVDWHPRGQFNDFQQNVQFIVGDVFERLTSAAAAHQDSAQEYRRTERQIRIRCGHAVARTVRQGGYGQGIDIIQLALNNSPPTLLPPLVVDGIFGARTDARVREFQGRHELTPDGIVGPLTRRALGI